jgi:threonine/homoserine/homoserine lactone efflux protein
MSGYGLATFGIAYFIAVATPGPGVAAVISQGLSRGLRGAPAFIAGFVAGDLSWFFAAALGLSAVAQTAHTAFVVVKYLGVVYLLYLAYKLWTAPVQIIGTEVNDLKSQKPLGLFFGSMALTLGNPKAMIFFVALLPSVVSVGDLNWRSNAQIAAMIAILQPLILGTYVIIASRARKLLRNSKSLKIVNRSSGSMIAAAAIVVATR